MKYKYRVVSNNVLLDSEIEKMLDRMSEDGWNLLYVIPMPGISMFISSIKYIFRKEVINSISSLPSSL